MISQAKKFQELAERGAIPCTCPPDLNHQIPCQQTVRIGTLARLVLTLSEALERHSHTGFCWPLSTEELTDENATCGVPDALAAVEELKL